MSVHFNSLYILIACRALFWNNVCGVVSHCNQFILIFLGVQVDVLALCVAFVFVLLYTFVCFVALCCGDKVQHVGVTKHFIVLRCSRQRAKYTQVKPLLGYCIYTSNNEVTAFEAKVKIGLRQVVASVCRTRSRSSLSRTPLCRLGDHLWVPGG